MNKYLPFLLALSASCSESGQNPANGSAPPVSPVGGSANGGSTATDPAMAGSANGGGMATDPTVNGGTGGGEQPGPPPSDGGGGGATGGGAAAGGEGGGGATGDGGGMDPTPNNPEDAGSPPPDPGEKPDVTRNPPIKQPNFILIESDDQHDFNVHSSGNSELRTPAIDAIAKAGVTFSSAYNMGAYREAVCVPSRTMLQTGSFVWEANKVKTQGLQGPMLSERLRAAGYDTYFTGKWHVDGKGVAQAYQNVGTIMAGQLDSFTTPQGHATDVTGDEAANFVREASKKNKPFFMFVGFNAPHTPREEPQKYYDMYPPASLTLTPSLKENEKHPYVTVNFAPNTITFDWARAEFQKIYGQITHMDEKVGDIVQALKETGEYDDTVIIFTSDHGDLHGEHGIVGKVNLYDLGVKAPLIMAGPGLPVDHTISEHVYLQDVHTTMLEMGEAVIGDYVDFKSLTPLLTNDDAKSAYESIYLGFMDGQRGVVHGDYKLMLYALDGTEAFELYNLKDDPWELNDLSDDPAQKPRMKALFQELLKWQTKQAEPMDMQARFGAHFQ